MMGYPRKTCKKAKAASLSLLYDGEEGLAALCEGVGGETCYPATRRLRRAGPPGRCFCGEPQQVGDAAEITIVSSSARRALQASLIFGAPPPARPGRSPPPSVFGKHNRSHMSEISLPRRGGATAVCGHVGHEGDEPQGEPLLPGPAGPVGPAPKKSGKGAPGHELGCDVGVLEGQPEAAAAGPTHSRTTTPSLWARFRSRLQRGACCLEPRDPSLEAPRERAR